MTGTAKRWLAAGIAAAVLAATAWTLAAQAGQSQAAPEKKPAERQSLRHELARDLFNVTPDQEKKLQELREAGRKDRQAYRDETLRMRGEMRELLKDPQANAAKVDKLIDGRARLQAEEEKKAFRSREEWRKVFTAEQLEKMKKYRGLLRERFGAGEGRRAGYGEPGMSRLRGRRAEREWGMGPGARRWRHPYARWSWDWY